MASQETQKQKLLQLVLASFAEAERTCTIPTILFFQDKLPGTSITFQRLMVALSACAVGVAVAIFCYLIIGHQLYWTSTREQKHIIKIIGTLIVFGLLSFFSVVFLRLAPYLIPIAQFYEGFGMVSLFMLYIMYLAPEDATREQFFDNLERRWINGKKKDDRGSLRWFRIVCLMVFQILPARTGTLIASEVLRCVTCPITATRQYGNLGIEVISGVNTALTVAGVIVFERRMHAELQPHHGVLKLVAFKSLVGLQATQAIIFSTLASKRIWSPSKYVSYMDFLEGVPNFMVCWEVFFCSLLFLKAYSFAPYKAKVQQGAVPQRGSFKAFVALMNPLDIFWGYRYLFTGHLRLSNGSHKESDNNLPTKKRGNAAQLEDELARPQRGTSSLTVVGRKWR